MNTLAAATQRNSPATKCLRAVLECYIIGDYLRLVPDFSGRAVRTGACPAPLKLGLLPAAVAAGLWSSSSSSSSYGMALADGDLTFAGAALAVLVVVSAAFQEATDQ